MLLISSHTPAYWPLFLPLGNLGVWKSALLSVQANWWHTLLAQAVCSNKRKNSKILPQDRSFWGCTLSKKQRDRRKINLVQNLFRKNLELQASHLTVLLHYCALQEKNQKNWYYIIFFPPNLAQLEQLLLSKNSSPATTKHWRLAEPWPLGPDTEAEPILAYWVNSFPKSSCRL